MENKNLVFRIPVAQLERHLAVAHNRIRDLTKIKALLYFMIRDLAPARVTKNAERPPPAEVPALPESRQSCRLPLGPSRLSSPALVTCLGESLPAGMRLNKSYTDIPVFDSSDRELYKDRKFAVPCKLIMTAC